MAHYLVENQNELYPNRQNQVNDLTQILWEASYEEPSIMTGSDEYTPLIKLRTFQEKLAVNLSQKALTLSVYHDDVPIEVTDQKTDGLTVYPKVSFVMGVNTAEIHPQELYARIYAYDINGYPVADRDSTFTVEGFQTVFFHTAAKLGLYQRAHSHNLAN